MSCSESNTLVGQLHGAAQNGITSVVAQLLVTASAEEVNMQNPVSNCTSVSRVVLYLMHLYYSIIRLVGRLSCLLLMAAT